jgi:biotin carboxylase
MKRALLLVRRSATITPLTVALLRSKGFEPFVLSSLPDDGGAEFRLMCARLEVECAVSAGVKVTLDEVAEVLARLEDCAFCLSLADTQRELMAEANRLLGTPDVDPAALRVAVDKHTMRTTLSRLGLSRLQSLRLTDPRARELIEGGEPFVVKPRNGTGSLCVGVVRSWADVAVLQDAFAEGSADVDMMAEYFVDNELIAESYFDGVELSVDLVRRDGRDLISVDHEKTVLEFGGGTVLERGMASPVVGLTAAQLNAVHKLAGEVLDALGLSSGCYHVELRVNEACEAEIVEINPRVGGAMIWDSIQLQYDRSVTADWVDVLAGREIEPLKARRCGTYQQLAHAEQRRPLMAADTNPKLPEPTVRSVRVCLGERSTPYRENFIASALWATDLDGHAEQVAELMAEEYFSFRYLPGLSGRPVVLVLEPADFEAVEVAAATGADVVVARRDPVVVAPEYAEACERIAALVRIASWADVEECHSLVREACAGSHISAVLAPPELTLLADRIRVEAGIAEAAEFAAVN